jgi:trimeric autotransporter adhesin
MKKNTTLILLAACILFCIPVRAQSIAINEDGAMPNANAILDVKSNNKGVLLPRLSSSSRLAMPNVKGMLVYDSVTNSFWYNTGTGWQNLAAGSATGNAWTLSGNAGNKSSYFLGTTDAQPLRLKVDNQPAGLITAEVPYNTFWGQHAGGLNTSGQGNTATGFRALSTNSSGTWNTAFGRSAIQYDSTGNENTAVGAFALGNGRGGSSNTAVGFIALRHTLGDYNTAVGSGALYTSSSAGHNTAVGTNALYSTTNGQINAALGSHALYLNKTGWLNTAVGFNALYNNITGDYNTAIGFNADVYFSSIFNATAIGFGAIVNSHNKVRIGNSSVFSIEGAVPFSTPSDARFKSNIQNDVKGLDFILQLQPVTYQFEAKYFDELQHAGLQGNREFTRNSKLEEAYAKAAAIRRSGFIAQDVEQAAAASGYDFSGLIKPQSAEGHYSISYESFVVPLVKAVQELHERIAQLEKENASLKKAGLK